LFEIQLNEPQNFAQHRQVEIDAARIQTYASLEQIPYFSKRFLMKRYLGLTEEEMQDNEEMWTQEQGEAPEAMDVGMRSVGVTPGALATDMDIADAAMPPPGAEAGMPGAEAGMAGAPGGAPPPTGAASPLGGAPAAAPMTA
jgi:hypothetical protein